MLRLRSFAAVAIVLGIGLAGCGREGGDASPPAPSTLQPQADEPLYLVPTGDLPFVGDPSALVTVVAFVDYECPFCSRVEETLSRLQQAYGEDLRVVVAPIALPMHPHARPAALAALAAAQQGRFAELHARLFALKGKVDEAGIARAAQEAGLSPRRFEADRASPATAAALESSEAIARRLGVTGTPMLFVNGRLVRGAQPYEVIAAIVDERREAARALASAGVPRSRLYERTVEGGLARINPPPAAPAAPAEPDEAPARIPPGGLARGPESASSTFVAFVDYECPYSIRQLGALRALAAERPGAVRLVVRQRPLPHHRHAREAALAALAAAEQGRFWEYQDRLVAEPQALDRAALVAHASALGLDVARFARDMDEPRLAARLDEDLSVADSLRVSATPTTFVNGRRMTGARDVPALAAKLAPR